LPPDSDPRLGELPHGHSDRRTPDRSLSVLIMGTSFDFPHGEGASARVYCYAKGLAAAGADVRVVSLVLPSRGRNPDDCSAVGIFDGLAYEYACGTRRRPASFWRRRLLWVRRAARTGSLVRATAAQSPGRCVVLIYSEVSSWILGLAILSRIVGASSVLDLCEFPLVWRPRTVRTSVHRALRMILACRLCDGIVPISTFLDDYVRQTPGPTPPTFRVPVMVDPALVALGARRAEGDAQRCALYCGSLSHVHEVERTIRVFAEATANLPAVRLTIVGGGPGVLKEQADALARSLGLAGRVEFVDRLKREDLVARMLAAEVLILPRAAGTFSQAGLPNKLGEYLASGRPVVATANGDIPLYLDDGVSVYLAEPGNDALFAARLRHALEHREEATAIGGRGREVARREFDYGVHGVRLLTFLSSLASSRRAAVSAAVPPRQPDGGC
jgi:glycosyltransferase involved in cell wall biosynthesis